MLINYMSCEAQLLCNLGVLGVANILYLCSVISFIYLMLIDMMAGLFAIIISLYWYYHK